MLMPTLIDLPTPPSEMRPCEAEENYSKNRCDLRWGWEQRIKEMERFYGDKVNKRERERGERVRRRERGEVNKEFGYDSYD